MNNGIGVTTHKCLYRKTIVNCVLIFWLFFCLGPKQGLANELPKDSGLQIYLPREVTIKDSILKLGNIGVVRGPQALVAKANDVMLGRLSVPGQEIVVEKNVILGRLAACGIPASQVTLQGAEKIAVRQRHNIIGTDEFVKMAETFLQENLAGDSISGWSPTRKPKDLVISNPGKNIGFSSELIQKGVKNQVAVKVTVFSDNKKIATRDVTFTLKYHSRSVVATADIPAGTMIDSENVKIEKSTSNLPEPTDWKPPYGLVAKRKLSAETVIRPHMLGKAKSPVVIKRNQNVVIRIEKPGFMITALGKAMQDGKVGEYIKIRNIDSQRIIVAKINGDSTVEPVF